MRIATILLAALCLTGCVSGLREQSAQDRFFDRLAALCGRAFEGRVTSPAVEADASFAGKRLVMHVRNCSADEIRIPFQVGPDRSRTWVVTRTGRGLSLKHDHRHVDGSADALTQYGGETADQGTAIRQTFPADAFSKGLFVSRNIPISSTNVWAMEVEPDRRFAYELRRPGRYFRVEFDLRRPVALPPPPWGSTDSP